MAYPKTVLVGDRVRYQSAAGTIRGEVVKIMRAPNAKNDLPYTKISVGMMNGLPRALELIDGLGSVVLVTLDKIQLNINVPANRFTFNPPAGAEVLRLN